MTLGLSAGNCWLCPRPNGPSIVRFHGLLLSRTSEDTLSEIREALSRFHQERVIFEETGVRVDGISLHRQHSLKHYEQLICMFGAPNGLCSSITESKHIAAVKEPWRRSSRFEALGQMLVTNQRLDKLAATRVDLVSRNMLDPPLVPGPGPQHNRKNSDDSDDPIVEGERVLGEVKLAKCASKSLFLFELLIYINLKLI